MGWHLHGTDFDFEIRVDEHGLSVSGKAHQIYTSQLRLYIAMKETEALPAYWSVYRASEAFEAASLISLDIRDMKRHLEPNVVKATTKPLCIIKYEPQREPDVELGPGDAPHIGFAVFLPDRRFADVWDALKRFRGGSGMQYWFHFGFVGFIPRRVEGHPEAVGYDEWLAGRPCLSDSFTFGVRPVVADDPDAGRRLERFR